eukprot:CAMPEP_0174887076 /NCGR_PEP_ID=MMETSP0167-20121228/2300_1 /TAXON_ID=38298 /ORGANISM="Rhodella maculata, Strain CCMP736" /LENGTH=368 /DNA_ID=CAMNT_0016123379 /DNA_START=61 /DNA_END=1167 /DNA_ORIENTATION=-
MATIPSGKGVSMLAAHDNTAMVSKVEIGRPAAGPSDVSIDIKYCGICHSDLHATNGDWGVNLYPMAAGHEIAGIATAVGADVKGIKVGDRVGVGCMVGSCRTCDLCLSGLEQHCPQMLQTYSAVFPDGKGDNYKDAVGHHTNGGYSTAITVDSHFVFALPDALPMEYVGPLLCAGVTTFSPLNRHVLKAGGGAGKTIGVVGFGGLGHMAVKLAKAMGCKVVVISRSDAKKADAAKLGAEILAHGDAEAVAAAARKFDVILDTVSAKHDVAPLVGMLKVGGKFVILGAPPGNFELSAFALLFSRHSVEGSMIGGIPETKEMLEFCTEHMVLPDIKIIKASEVNEQLKALADGSASAARAVIDISTIAEM